MIYLNNTSTSFPKPPEVIETVTKFLNTPPIHSARSGFERDMEDIDYSCRTKIAKLINAPDPYHIVFSSGSTESLNLAIKGNDLKGSHVVSTAIEHNSVIRPLKTMELNSEIELTFVQCDSTGYVETENIRKAIKPNTRAIVVNHCSNVTGSILDIQEIAKIAHENGCIIIVDASQSAGNIPIDVSEWDIDFLAFTGHKSLYGLPGIGGLYVKEGHEPKPLKVGGTGVLSEVLVQPAGFPLHYEAGTQNMPGIASLDKGVDFVMNTGLENIHAHKAKIVRYMMEELGKLSQIAIYTVEEHNSLGNFCFNIKGMVPEEVGYVLESSYDIIIRTGLHCAPLMLEALGVHPWGTVRVSPSYFTQDNEVEEFIDAIKDVIKNFCK
jgi:cysteine desulfurase family protein